MLHSTISEGGPIVRRSSTSEAAMSGQTDWQGSRRFTPETRSKGPLNFIRALMTDSQIGSLRERRCEGNVTSEA